MPVTTATPTIPIASPSARARLRRSCGRKRRTRSALKIGTDAWTTAASPESMCCSPHAISQNGIAALSRPRTRRCRQAARSSSRARAAPKRQTTYATSTAAASSVRTAIIGAGSISSTATLMKRYDAPQTAARSRIIGQ
jgi:hypothetical protein